MRGSLRRLLGGSKPTGGVEDAEPVPTNDERAARAKYTLSIENDPTATFQWSGHISGPLGGKYLMASSEDALRREAKEWLDAILSTKGRQKISGSDL